MFTFIEEPSTARSKQERHLRLSKARSHAALAGYRRRYLHDPWAHISSNRPTRELRSLAFYRERTSVEWSSWSDAYFWKVHALQLAAAYPSVSEALDAIALFHESTITGNADTRSLSVVRGQQAITRLVKTHASTPMTVILAQTVIHTSLGALFNDIVHNEAVKTQFALLDSVADDDYVASLLKRQRSLQCQMHDPRLLLSQAAIQQPQPFNKHFDTLESARESLEGVLNNLARQSKSAIPIDKTQLEEWQLVFDQLRTKVNHTAWLGLKGACGMAVITVETLYSQCETDFDDYLLTFRDVADAFEAMLCDQSKPSARFGLDGGLLMIVGQAARWCRDPPLRARLIDLLRKSQILEGIYSSGIYARVCDMIRQVEEESIVPPPATSQDVPEHKRVRCYSGAVYAKIPLLRLNFLRYPYTGPLESVSSDFVHESIQIENDASTVASGHEPDHITGPTYKSTRQYDGSYYTLQASEFFFALPRFS